MLKKSFFAVAISIVSFISASAQSSHIYDYYKPQGEFGIALGLGHYFGDLNTNASLNRPKFSGGIFFIKQFNNYIGVKISGDYAFLGYSDIYSKNETQKRRNLSFNTNVWEGAISGYFNFFRFIPGVKGYSFTPYVSLGIGLFSYDPYAYLQGEKYFLRPLGTEGQGDSAYPMRKPYGNMGICFPLSVGMKYAISDRVNVFGELTYRFTNTDYLDDVSTTYAGPQSFYVTDAEGNTAIDYPAYYLQDRSYETGDPIGIKGRQRGNSSQNDAYLTLHVGISLNLSSYNCPKAVGDHP